MLRDFVETIAAMAKSNMAPVVQDLDERTHLVTYNGSKEERPKPSPIRDHRVIRLVDLIEAINAFGGKTAAILHDYSIIACELDSADRRDRVSVPLTATMQFVNLEALAKPRAQKDFILFLRRIYQDALPDGFLDSVRSVTFSRSADGHGTVAHGKESLGRSVEAVVESSVAAIPERIDIDVPLYVNPDFPSRRAVACYVFIDAETQQFSIQTAPDEQVRMIRSVHEDLHDILASMSKDLETTVTVLAGQITPEA
jgi:hypothetical protein